MPAPTSTPLPISSRFAADAVTALQARHLASGQQLQGDPGGAQAGQQRQHGQPWRVADRGAQLERQHADEVHGPDAAAQGQGAGEQRRLPVQGVAAETRHARHLQGHAGGEGGDRQRQRHQPRVVAAEQEQAGIGVEKEQAGQIRHAGGDYRTTAEILGGQKLIGTTMLRL